MRKSKCQYITDELMEMLHANRDYRFKTGNIALHSHLGNLSITAFFYVSATPGPANRFAQLLEPNVKFHICKMIPSIWLD